MNATSDREKIRGFLSAYLKRPAPSDDQDYFKLGLVNSLFAMQLVLFVEKEFNIKVATAELVRDNFRSIDAITRYVGRVRAADRA